MKTALFLAAVTIALSFAVGFVASHYGGQVSARFLERGAYTLADFKGFVTDHPDQARGYAFPVLFPCDLLFMVFLAGFLGLASVTSAESIDWLRKASWIFAIAPALYLASDLVEDALLAWLLLHPQSIDEGSVSHARAATVFKLGFSAIAIGHTIVLSAIAITSGR